MTPAFLRLCRARVALCGVRTYTTHRPKPATDVLVIYRGGPYMRKPYFYLAGACFILAGLNFGLFIRDFLVWPLLPSENTESVPAKPAIRYSIAGGTILFASLIGWYFWYAPSRMVTRLTIYPATRMLGVRTSAPSPAYYLPHFITQRDFFRRAGTFSPTDKRERLVPLEAVYRLQGSAEGSEMQTWEELLKSKRKNDVPPNMSARIARFNLSTTKYDRQDMLMVRVGHARLAFQMSARPSEAFLLQEPPKRTLWRRLFRGPTDWSDPPQYTPSVPERAAHERRAALPGADVEPWFLDRANFDKLFPLDASRYKRAKKTNT